MPAETFCNRREIRLVARRRGLDVELIHAPARDRAQRIDPLGVLTDEQRRHHRAMMTAPNTCSPRQPSSMASSIAALLDASRAARAYW